VKEQVKKSEIGEKGEICQRREKKKKEKHHYCRDKREKKGGVDADLSQSLPRTRSNCWSSEPGKEWRRMMRRQAQERKKRRKGVWNISRTG